MHVSNKYLKSKVWFFAFQIRCTASQIRFKKSQSKVYWFPGIHPRLRNWMSSRFLKRRIPLNLHLRPFQSKSGLMLKTNIHLRALKLSKLLLLSNYVRVVVKRKITLFQARIKYFIYSKSLLSVITYQLSVGSRQSLFYYR